MHLVFGPMRGCSINCSCFLRRAQCIASKICTSLPPDVEKVLANRFLGVSNCITHLRSVQTWHCSSGRAFDHWDFAKKIRAQYASTLFGHVRDGGTSMISQKHEAPWVHCCKLTFSLRWTDLHFLSCRCCVDCQPSAGACSRFNLCRPGWMPISTSHMKSCLLVLFFNNLRAQNGPGHLWQGLPVSSLWQRAGTLGL